MVVFSRKAADRALAEAPCLVVTAPPGAGKSTILPLTILQGRKDGKILVLEPRRIAARQIAERMAALLGEPVGRTVGYRIRFESRVSAATRIEVLTEGTGRSPKATDTVRCHYEGRLLDGSVFDSSYQRGEPADFGLNQVIAGWTEGVQLMKEGAKYRFFIPYLLAYGERGAGSSIPPYSTLIFDVELIKVL